MRTVRSVGSLDVEGIHIHIYMGRIHIQWYVNLISSMRTVRSVRSLDVEGLHIHINYESF